MTLFHFESVSDGQVPTSFFFGAVNPQGLTQLGAPYSLKPGVGADLLARDPALPDTTLVSAVAPRDGTMTRLSVQHTIAGGAAVNVFYTIFVDGLTTGSFVTIAANAAAPVVSSLNLAIAVTQGQRIEVLVTLDGDLADPPDGIYAAIDFV